jgi:lipoprotein-anchoring transpeptidase ErfK/SrfK
MLNLRNILALGALAAALTLSATATAAPLYPQQPMEQQAPQVEEDTEAFELPERFKRQVVAYTGPEAAGTIIVDTPNTYLYFVLGGGRAIRYGIGVGREGFTWSGVQSITKKSEWPDWHPPADMLARQPYLPRFMAGGPGNPLGARAMYLGGTIYRIHGTNNPSTIGGRVSSGCIRMTNDDVADLYSRVNIGTKVIVKPMDRRAELN